MNSEKIQKRSTQIHKLLLALFTVDAHLKSCMNRLQYCWNTLFVNSSAIPLWTIAFLESNSTLELIWYQNWLLLQWTWYRILCVYLKEKVTDSDGYSVSKTRLAISAILKSGARTNTKYDLDGKHEAIATFQSNCVHFYGNPFNRGHVFVWCQHWVSCFISDRTVLMQTNTHQWQTLIFHVSCGIAKLWFCRRCFSPR